MVSDEPLWCWWLLMVVNSPRWLNLQKNMFCIQTAWALKAKMLTWHKHTHENHSLFSLNIGIRKKSYAHFPHKHQHFCRGWTEVSSNLLEETLLPLSVSNSCIFFRPILSANINAESARFSWLFLAKDWMKLPHVYFPFSHWHLFCFGGTMYHRLILTHRICYSSLHHRKSVLSTGLHNLQTNELSNHCCVGHTAWVLKAWRTKSSRPKGPLARS